MKQVLETYYYDNGRKKVGVDLVPFYEELAKSIQFIEGKPYWSGVKGISSRRWIGRFAGTLKHGKRYIGLNEGTKFVHIPAFRVLCWKIYKVAPQTVHYKDNDPEYLTIDNICFKGKKDLIVRGRENESVDLEIQPSTRKEYGSRGRTPIGVPIEEDSESLIKMCDEILFRIRRIEKAIGIPS